MAKLYDCLGLSSENADGVDYAGKEGFVSDGKANKRISQVSVHIFFVKNPPVSAQSALSAFTIPLKSEQMHETTIKLRFYPHERDVLQNLVRIF